MTESSVVKAIDFLDLTMVDLVITDVKMPEVDGLDLVRHVRENLKDTEALVITGYPNVSGALSAMKNGAVDYLTKPFTDAELLTAVDRAVAKIEMRRLDEEPIISSVENHGLLGESRAIQEVAKQIERASRNKATVLLLGESGTGKELAARAIHYSSERASAPFVPVNCGAIPQQLIESELFGYVKGAFTGATESRAGFFMTADGGTIFLDELAETSAAMQVRLLRVLQESEVCMVGSSRPRKVDVRIIAATNKDLEQAVRQGIFREDLYFRINVLSIHMPSMRERELDVVHLAKHFASKFSTSLGRPVPEFSDRVFNVFQNYSWPGNVRELENVIQRLIVMSDDSVVDVPDLPSVMRFSVTQSEQGRNRTLAEVEIDHINSVLESVGGNKTLAAEILGIDRKTLRSRLQGNLVKPE
jgi:DNA-binding NtrC family response regulator